MIYIHGQNLLFNAFIYFGGHFDLPSISTPLIFYRSSSESMHLAKPSKVKSIVGDGNCFRCISYSLTRIVEHHFILRTLLVNFKLPKHDALKVTGLDYVNHIK